MFQIPIKVTFVFKTAHQRNNFIGMLKIVFKYLYFNLYSYTHRIVVYSMYCIYFCYVEISFVFHVIEFKFRLIFYNWLVVFLCDFWRDLPLVCCIRSFCYNSWLCIDIEVFVSCRLLCRVWFVSRTNFVKVNSTSLKKISFKFNIQFELVFVALQNCFCVLTFFWVSFGLKTRKQVAKTYYKELL